MLVSSFIHLLLAKIFLRKCILCSLRELRKDIHGTNEALSVYTVRCRLMMAFSEEVFTSRSADHWNRGCAVRRGFE